ncbi:GNAT family N-acetyltransferase [candidate division KSB1 bacterium]|nr:GNAT family N-acetyltransferase [candidate division KSB1 bacterium]
MLSYTLREMRSADLPAVNRVLSKAFTSARIDEGYKNAYVRPCHLSFLEMYLANFPGGCFVMENKQSLFGYTFAHLLGQVGWLGPLSILPAQQGKHLGHEIVLASIKALQHAGAQVIGLETAPRNYRNLGFYSKLGFQPGRLTLDLTKRVPPVAGESLPSKYEVRFIGETEGAQRAELLDEADELARRIDPCLALRNEIALTLRFNYGDALCLREGKRMVACALAHTETYSEDEAARYLKVITLLIEPKRAELPGQVVQLLCNWASHKHLDTVSVRTPTRYARAYHALLGLGFRVFHAELRMTLKGFHERAHPREFYLSKWE